ncbi:MAG: hypothetical protein C4323_25590 [Mastigocladus sp. ERB_26_2]
MDNLIVKVTAFWDREADVWVASSDDVPGLVTEASTIEALTEKLKVMIPELFELNQIEIGKKDYIDLDLTTHRREAIKVAC